MEISKKSNLIPTLTENVNFSVKVKSDEIQKHLSDIKAIAKDLDFSLLKNGNDLQVNYRITLEYFDNVNSAISSLLNLCREGVVVDLDYSEAQRGESIILELGRNIERIRKINQKLDKEFRQ